MNAFMIGNLISFIGCLLMVYTGFLKEKRTILAVQCVQFGFLGAANLILGAVTGFISALVNMARNLVFSRWQCNRLWKIGFIVLQLALSLPGLNGTFLAWLPVIASAIFGWLIDTKQEWVLKAAIVAAQILWAIYDLSYWNVVGFTFDVLTVASNLYGIWRILRKKK